MESAVPAASTASATTLAASPGTAVTSRTLASRPLRRRLRVAVPAFGAAGVLFGAWYALGALGTVPYVF